MLYAIVGLLVIIADQWVKFWVANHISMSSVGEDFIPGILSLVNVHNDGAAFGFLSGSGARIPFIVLAGVFALVVILALATKLISGKLARWSIVLVAAGGLSNCLDRVIYGYVQDMFKCEFINFPVFNVADIFITVFAIIFAIAVIFGKTRPDDDDEDEEFEDEEEEEEEPRISRRKQRRLRRAEEEEDEEEEEAPPVRVKKEKKEKKTPRSRRRGNAEEAEETEEAEVPAAAVTKKPAAEAPKPQKAPAAPAAPAAKPAAPAAPAKEDPFAAWERANARVEAQKPSFARQQPAAKPAAPATTRRMEKVPAPAPAKPAAPARPAAPAKPAAKPVVEEEFSLDDILNEFR